jgi:parvulin-like peptidyl-prolyl isomerase
MKRNSLGLAMMGLALTAGGCGLTQPEPLVPSQFVRSRAAVGPNPVGQPVGQSGALVYGELHSPLVPDEYPNVNRKPAPGLSPLVRQEIPAPGEGAGAHGAPVAAAAVTNEPAATTAPGTASGYQVVGTVLATVDTTPIFADKVLASLERELAAEAHKYPPETFRQAAQQDIEQKIQELIHNQLEIERASSALNQDSKSQAQMYAQVWRRQQITTAGGSEAIARQRAKESGDNFDDLVRDQYNTALVQIYYQQRVAPKIHVSASDMRRYYFDHLDTEFTKHAEARFRLIRIDFGRSGGPEQAAAKANDIIKDLKAGVDFAEEASKYNDDASLKAKGGDVGSMQKGNFRYEKVEDAVWALQPGEYTDKPIEVSEPTTAFYIAKLESRKGGTVQPFDSPAVQKYIEDKLFSQQLGALREKELADLVGQAVIFREPKGLETAVDMAMQRYPAWASAR